MLEIEEFQEDWEIEYSIDCRLPNYSALSCMTCIPASEMGFPIPDWVMRQRMMEAVVAYEGGTRWIKNR